MSSVVWHQGKVLLKLTRDKRRSKKVLRCLSSLWANFGPVVRMMNEDFRGLGMDSALSWIELLYCFGDTTAHGEKLSGKLGSLENRKTRGRG